MPRICIARLELHDLGDPDAALDTLDAAFDFIDEEADLIEAIFVKTEALLARDEPAGRARGARRAVDLGDRRRRARARSRRARARRRGSGAARCAGSRSRARTTEHARPTRSTCSAASTRQRGDRAAMIAAWQEVRAARPRRAAGRRSRSPRTSSSGSRRDTLAELPATVRAELEHVPILIDDLPSEDLVADGFDPRTLGLFQGARCPTTATLAADRHEHPAVQAQPRARSRDDRRTSPRRSASPCCTRPRTTSGSTRTTSRSSASTAPRVMIGEQRRAASVPGAQKPVGAAERRSSTRPRPCTARSSCRTVPSPAVHPARPGVGRRHVRYRASPSARRVSSEPSLRAFTGASIGFRCRLAATVLRRRSRTRP